jgi:hypothetical protein
MTAPLSKSADVKIIVFEPTRFETRLANAYKLLMGFSFGDSNMLFFAYHPRPESGT